MLICEDHPVRIVCVTYVLPPHVHASNLYRYLYMRIPAEAKGGRGGYNDGKGLTLSRKAGKSCIEGSV